MLAKPVTMKRAFFVLLALLCLGAGLTDKAVSIGGAYPGQSAADLETVKGQPESVVQGDLMVYNKGQVMVRVKDGEVVYVAGWDLESSGRSLQLKGVASDYVRRTLGPPQQVYTKGALDCWLYPGSNADVGVLVQQHVVAGYILQHPGTLLPTLEQAGYRAPGP